MSWDQQYVVPSVESLLEDITGFTAYALLKKELAAQGVLIIKEEEILLDSGMYQDVKGTKITLSDGRVYVPKLVQKYTSDGNYGCDSYKYVLENETPGVNYVNEDNVVLESNDEYPLESDGEIDSPIDEAME